MKQKNRAGQGTTRMNIALAKKANVPWEWCINDQYDGGRVFCPIWVILGSSRTYTMEGNKLKEYFGDRQTKNLGEKGKKGKGTREAVVEHFERNENIPAPEGYEVYSAWSSINSDLGAVNFIKTINQ